MHEHNEKEHLTAAGSSPLRIALVIVIFIMLFEVAGGILSNSLALLSDAGHMLVDALALGLSLFAVSITGKPATPTRTYGYHRVEVMAALVNGTSLVVVSIYVFYEAYRRFFDPPVINIPLMLLVAAFGLMANVAGILLLRKASHRNLNIKAAFWHVVGDTLSSVGVILAGVIIWITGWNAADPLVAGFIGCIILWGAVRLVRESADILLEAVPRDIQIEKVIEAVKAIPGVENIHDVHIWTITSGIYSLSAHLRIADQKVSESAEIVEKVNHNLAEKFQITHTTLQIECETCTVHEH